MTRMDPIARDCCGGSDAMIAPEAALALAKTLKPGDLPITLASLLGARGLVLATDIMARQDAPPFDASAMDGYAINAADAAQDGTKALPVVGQVLAGDPPTALPDGAAIRILTGAALPAGADCVVMQEDVEVSGARIRFSVQPRPWQHVRRRGDDLAAGDCVLTAGRIMGPREIAAAAAAGHGTVAIRTRLPVALISTGSELRDAGARLDPGQIWNVNLPMLAALADQRWIDQLPAQTVPDRIEPLTLALKGAAKDARLIVTTGGAVLISAEK